MLSQKIRKIGTAKKHYKTQDMWMAGGPSWGYVGHHEAYVGPCWPTCSHKGRKIGKSGKSTKHRKTRDSLALPTLRRGETPTARTRPGGPWPDLSAYAQQPARGPTMVAVVAGVGVAVVAGRKSGARVVGGSGVVFCEALGVVVGGWPSVGSRRAFCASPA